MTEIRALLVDDHPLFRDGFVAAITQKLPAAQFTTAGSVAQARSMHLSLRPQIVLSDWRLPDGDGLVLLAELAATGSTALRVLLSGVDDVRLPERARAAGLQGFLPKTLEPSLLVVAFERILQGHTFFPIGAVRRPSTVLTARQQHILTMLSEGNTNKQIALQLNISERTVKDHVSLIFERLGAKNRADAITRASSCGLL